MRLKTFIDALVALEKEVDNPDIQGIRIEDVDIGVTFLYEINTNSIEIDGQEENIFDIVSTEVKSLKPAIGAIKTRSK